MACIDLKTFEQFRLWWGSAFWQQGGHSRKCLAIQVSKYFPDDNGVFDAGNDAYITTALIASFNIDIENTLQPFCPGHRGTFFCRALVKLLCWMRFLVFTSLSRCYLCPILAIGCKYAIKRVKFTLGLGTSATNLEIKSLWKTQCWRPSA